MKQSTVLVLVAASLLTGSITWSLGQGESKATTKKVMKDHFKGDTSDIKKAGKGELTKEQVSALLGAVKSLPDNKPPNGEEASWKEKTTALVAALEKLDKGEVGASEAVKDAANCKACHDAHKGK